MQFGKPIKITTILDQMKEQQQRLKNQIIRLNCSQKQLRQHLCVLQNQLQSSKQRQKLFKQKLQKLVQRERDIHKTYSIRQHKSYQKFSQRERKYQQRYIKMEMEMQEQMIKCQKYHRTRQQQMYRKMQRQKQKLSYSSSKTIPIQESINQSNPINIQSNPINMQLTILKSQNLKLKQKIIQIQQYKHSYLQSLQEKLQKLHFYQNIQKLDHPELYSDTYCKHLQKLLELYNENRQLSRKLQQKTEIQIQLNKNIQCLNKKYEGHALQILSNATKIFRKKQDGYKNLLKLQVKVINTKIQIKDPQKTKQKLKETSEQLQKTKQQFQRTKQLLIVTKEKLRETTEQVRRMKQQLYETNKKLNQESQQLQITGQQLRKTMQKLNQIEQKLKESRKESHNKQNLLNEVLQRSNKKQIEIFNLNKKIDEKQRKSNEEKRVLQEEIYSLYEEIEGLKSNQEKVMQQMMKKLLQSSTSSPIKLTKNQASLEQMRNKRKMTIIEPQKKIQEQSLKKQCLPFEISFISQIQKSQQKQTEQSKYEINLKVKNDEQQQRSSSKQQTDKKI